MGVVPSKDLAREGAFFLVMGLWSSWNDLDLRGSFLVVPSPLFLLGFFMLEVRRASFKEGRAVVGALMLGREVRRWEEFRRSIAVNGGRSFVDEASKDLAFGGIRLCSLLRTPDFVRLNPDNPSPLLLRKAPRVDCRRRTG